MWHKQLTFSILYHPALHKYSETKHSSIPYNLSPLIHSSTMKMASSFKYPISTCLSHLLVSAIALLLISRAKGDSAQEKQKCAEQLTGLASCLPYLGGDAKAPTSDCCSGLKQAIINNKKCICLILKDRDDPDLGLKVNITLALGLPSLCKAPDNFSQCPALLHLDPKSAEAQAFNQLGPNNSNGGSISPSPSPDDGNAEGSSQNGKNKGAGETGTAKNGASYKGERLTESSVAVLLIWFFWA